MDYSLKLDSFDGPLDLLWHLIKTAKMDVLDLNLEYIINQYLDYIEAMEKMDLDIASSYLVMSAELIEMKSKLLLPRYEEEEEEEDLEQNLVDRLVEYKKYKELALSFKDLESERRNYHTKLPEPLSDFIAENTEVNFGDVSLTDLVEALKKFLEEEELKKPLPKKISRKEITVDERIVEIKNKFKLNKKIKFRDFFEVLSKENIVVTFLAILEMVKDGDVSISQGKNFEEIYCEVKE